MQCGGHGLHVYNNNNIETKILFLSRLQVHKTSHECYAYSIICDVCVRTVLTYTYIFSGGGVDRTRSFRVPCAAEGLRKKSVHIYNAKECKNIRRVYYAYEIVTRSALAAAVGVSMYAPIYASVYSYNVAIMTHLLIDKVRREDLL